MANFIELGDSMINLDQVREIKKSWDKIAANRVVRVTYIDGTSMTFRDAFGVDELLAAVIPAADGFQMLRFWFWDADPTVDKVIAPLQRDPIIAWRLCQYGPMPVALESNSPNWGEGDEAILRPDGVVTAPGIGIWKDINAWAEDVCVQWKEWREKKKAEAA